MADAKIQPAFDEIEQLRQRVVELEARQRSVMHSNMFGMLVWNESGRVLEANDSLLEMIGRERDALAAGALHLGELTPPEFHELDRRAQQQIKVKGVCAPYEKRLFAGDGAQLPVLVGGAALDGAPPRNIGFVLDISERKHTEEALQRSEERFRTLAHNVPGVVYLCHNDTRYSMLYLNEWVKQLTGIPAREFLEDRISFVELYHPDDAAGITPQVDAAVSQREPFHLLYRLRHADGSWRWVEENGQGVYSADGELEYLGGTIVDVTDRKAAEDALLEAHAQLERRVAARTVELQETNEKLRQEIVERRRAEESLRDERNLLRKTIDQHERHRQLLAYEIHDGLAQYITGALMHLESFARSPKLPVADDEQFQRGKQLLRDTIQEARRLITGLRPPILDEAGIAAAIEYLISEQEPAPPEGIEFTSHLENDRLPGLQESTLFRTAQEALTNITKHSETPRAAITLVQSELNVRLEIRDWGRGFDTKAVAPRSHGLHGIRERARLLGGTATIDSQPGEGTRVMVELPLGAVD